MSNFKGGIEVECLRPIYFLSFSAVYSNPYRVTKINKSNAEVILKYNY